MLFPKRRWSKRLQFLYEITDFLNKLWSFRRRDPLGAQTVPFNTGEIQQLFKKLHALLGRVITIQVMTVSEVSPTYVDTVYALLKCAQHVVR